MAVHEKFPDFYAGLENIEDELLHKLYEILFLKPTTATRESIIKRIKNFYGWDLTNGNSEGICLAVLETISNKDLFEIAGLFQIKNTDTQVVKKQIIDAIKGLNKEVFKTPAARKHTSVSSNKSIRKEILKLELQRKILELELSDSDDEIAEEESKEKLQSGERVFQWANENPVHPPEPDLSKTMSQLLARQSVNTELTRFGGNTLEWLTFIRDIRQSTSICGFSAQENVSRIRKALFGPALESVRMILLTSEDPEEILGILKENFGQPEMLIRCFKDEVSKVPMVESWPEFIKFSNTVRGLYSSILSAKVDVKSCNGLLPTLINKLPPFISLQWGNYMISKEIIQPNVQHFTEWIITMSSSVMRLSFSANMNVYQEKITTWNNASAPKNTSTQVYAQSSRLPDRNRDNQPLCFKCRKYGHVAKYCKNTFALQFSTSRTGGNPCSYKKIAYIDGKALTALVDTGSVKNVIREDVVDSTKTERISCSLVGLNQSKITCEAGITTLAKIDGEDYGLNLVVVPKTAIEDELILGQDFLNTVRWSCDGNNIVFKSCSQVQNEEAEVNNSVMRIEVEPNELELKINRKLSPKHMAKIKTFIYDFSSTEPAGVNSQSITGSIISGAFFISFIFLVPLFLFLDLFSDEARRWTNAKPNKEEQRKAAMKNIEKDQEAQRRRFNTKRYVMKYRTGDLILLRREAPATGQSRKLEQKYRGPYIVTKELPNGRYVVTDVPGYRVSQKFFDGVAAVDKMEQYHSMNPEEAESSEEDDNEFMGFEDDEIKRKGVERRLKLLEGLQQSGAAD